MIDKDKLIKRLKGLKQYKNFSEEEIDKLAQRKLEEKELTTSFIGFKDEEIDRAISLYYKYVEENSFESLAEKSTLINLVYLELLKERIQTFIKKEGDEKQGAIPLQMTEKILDLDTQILQLKEKLGMLKDKGNDSFINTWNELKEKALAYYSENSGESYVKCPECQSLFRLLMKVDDLEPAKATFFRGTTLYNQKLMELYHYKKVTLEDCAEIMGVNSKYITFIYENIYLKKAE